MHFIFKIVFCVIIYLVLSFFLTFMTCGVSSQLSIKILRNSKFIYLNWLVFLCLFVRLKGINTFLL